MSVTKTIKAGIDSGHGTALLYAGLIGLVLSDALPTPADAIVFTRQRTLKKQYEAKEITPKQYWRRVATGYYLYNVAWWLLVATAVVATKGTAEKKLKVGGAILGAGVVLAVLHKNIVQDEKDLALEEETKKTESLIGNYDKFKKA